MESLMSRRKRGIQQVANIDIELKSVYKNRNNRLQERIEAMNEKD